MHRRQSRTVSLARVLSMSALAAVSSCAGTPLPEPPDELPKPDYGSFFARDAAAPVNFPQRSTLQLSAGPGAVKPNTQVWIINLDASDPAVQVSAAADGSFVAPPLAGAANDRVRVLSRTERQHSAPLDLGAITTDSAIPVLESAPLSDTGLSCLSVTPAATLNLQGPRGSLRLSNACQVAVDLTRVALRFGDLGFAVSSPATQLNAGQNVELTLEDSRAPSASERLEIVLIDAQASDGRQGRYAIDVFSVLE
jgi:hypothetical protein